MASPQVENGYTKLSNELLEALVRTDLSAREYRVLLAIIRETYGWKKKKAKISTRRIAEITGINRSKVHPVLKQLISRKIVTAPHVGSRLAKNIGIQKDYTQWKPATAPHGGSRLAKNISIQKDCTQWKPATKKRQLLPTGGAETAPHGGSSIKKRKKRKKQLPVYPEWLDQNLWKQFKLHRVKVKAPMTPYAEKLAISKLEKLCDGDMTRQHKLIEQSIASGWKGIFPLKSDPANMEDVWTEFLK